MKTPGPPPVDVMAGFAEYFNKLDDPRNPLKTHHALLNVLLIAVLGVLCGAEGWVDLAVFAKAKQAFLATILDLPHGVPGKDTFRRVFEALEPSAFRRCFLRWIEALVGRLQGTHVALDGKALRAALAHRDVLPLHLVHAFVVDHQALFAQVAGYGKGQELDALPDLLRLLDVRGALVTIDALGCQRELAQQILDQVAHYLLAVKDNQPTLHADVRHALEAARATPHLLDPGAHARTEEHGHGRHEVREAWVLNDVSTCPEAATWPRVRTLVMIERTRMKGDDVEQTSHCYISSATLTADSALTAVRRHWSIENGLHWTLDVAFREDQCRIHGAHGAQNFALLRRLAFNALKREKTFKHGIRAKQKKCGWDINHEYLLRILQLMTPTDDGSPSPMDNKPTTGIDCKQ